ncbi:MAG: TonB-dependent receptor [Gammaproteobacteria bacterium]|nr:TonB-dependent receptor [Gammaproteobacteria bacterium]
MNRSKLNCAILTALAATSVTYAEEADTENSGLETIIITATKRSESIQEVPVSVTAISGETMEKLGVDNFQEYVEFLPNVVFQGTGPGQNEIYIRGAATNQTNICVGTVQALQPSVAFYLDEQPVSMQGRNLDVYAADMQRIEVLPGPQGTLFGASSQSGTVRLISNKPDHAGFSAGFDVTVNTTSGGEMSNSTQAFINLVLTDDLAVRITAYNDQQGGWIDNILNDPDNGGYGGSTIVIDRISGGVIGNAQTIDVEDIPITAPNNDGLVEKDSNDAVYAGVRFGISYNINDDWDILFQHTQQNLSTEGVFAYDPNLAGESSTNRFFPDNNDDEFGLSTWTLEGRLDYLDFVYTGGYLDREINTTIDYTGYTNGGLYAAYYACNYWVDDEADAYCADPTKYFKESTTTSRLTHEFRITTDAEKEWRVTAGVFLDEQDLSTVGKFQLGNTDLPSFTSLGRMLAGSEGINSNGGPFESEISFANDVTHSIDQVAVFGQFEYDLTDTVTASIGARWYEIEDTFKGATTTVDVSGRLRAFGEGDLAALEAFFGEDDAAAYMAAIDSGQLDISLLDDNGTLTVDDTIFKASLDWHIQDDVMLFATYSEGFRPPVTNRVGGGLASNQAGAFEGFRIPVYSTTDTLENYELGIKSTLLDNKLRINATYYWSEITDLQTSRFDPTNISFLVFTDNVGDAEIYGIDGDFTWVASDNLTISGAFSLLDTELTSINPELAGIAPAVGSKLPYSADFSANLQAEYFFNISNELNGYVRGGFSYTGDRLAGMKMDAYVLEETTELVYGTGTGLSIQREADSYLGVNYSDINGDTFAGGRYIQDSYILANITFGITNGDWNLELFINNITDEKANLYIDSQQFTPKVVTNRPRQVGLRISYDFF